MVGFLLGAVAASFYLSDVLEILKLRRFRFRQVDAAVPRPSRRQEDVDEGVARELETGTFEAVDPETGSFAASTPRRASSTRWSETRISRIWTIPSPGAIVGFRSKQREAEQ